MEEQTDLFTDNLSIDECDLLTKDGRKRGLEKIAKWAMSKPLERIKAIEVLGKMEGDFVIKQEENSDITIKGGLPLEQPKDNGGVVIDEWN